MNVAVQVPDPGEVSCGVISSPSNQVACPVCERSCVDPPLYRYTVEQAAAHFCPPTRNADRNDRLRRCIERLWEAADCLVLRCSNCGFGFGYPFVGGDEEFYSILHEQKDYPSWRWDYTYAVSEGIEKFPGGKILDIGAGVGKFLQGLDDNWECYAVEGSELTRGALESSGIEVFRNLSEATQSHGGKFQVVTLFQVLEHIADFNLILEQCHHLLAPGGRLVVTVPDGDAMIRQERMTGCPDMPPNHINKWTPKSLAVVMQLNGFVCGEAAYEPSSWGNLKANLHMRVSTNAARQSSLSAQAYRISNRTLRIAALSIFGASALLRMLPYGRQLVRGGAFAIVGLAN